MFTTLTEGLQSVKKQVLDQVSPESKLYVPVGGKRTTSPDEPPFDLLEAVQQFLVFEQPASAELVERRIEAKESAKTKEERVKEGIVKESEAKEAREITAVEGIKKTHKTKEIQETKETLASKGDYRKVLLLRGEVGSGKSSFCHHLEAKLWKDYHESQPIPLFISLPLLKDPIHHAIEETLTLYGFSPEQIAALKKAHSFIFILDGYDELHQFKNLYMSNRLYEWQAKVIITCRSQALYHVEDVDKYFMPFEGEKRQPWLLREYYVAPFSEEQIEAYIQLYEASAGIKSEPVALKEITITFKDKEETSKGAKKEKDQKSDKSEEKETVQEKEKDEAKEKESKKGEFSPTYQKLQSIPGLEKLIKTPFLLHLALEALPDVLAKHQEKDGKDWRCTQAILYDLFVARWFKRQEDKLKASRHLDEKAEDIKPKFWQYCKELALKMREQEVTYIAYERTQRSSDLFSESIPVPTIENPWDKFFKADKSLDLIRSACPLREYGKGVYGFFHGSMIEYFATRAMYEELIATPQSTVLFSSERAASAQVKKVLTSASTVAEKETKSVGAETFHQQTSSALTTTEKKETKAAGSTKSPQQAQSTDTEKRKAVVSITAPSTSTPRDSLFTEYEEYEERKEDRLFPEEDSETSVSPKETTKPKLQGHLHAKSFTHDLVAVSFLADRLAPGEEAREHFKATLFQTLEMSKKEKSYAIGAANAITILNFARIQFSGMDFRGIRVPDADVSYGVFDNTQFQSEKTDLTNVTFTGAWLRQANLTGATMSGVKFGEWPYIKFEKAVNACVFSPDGQWFAVGCWDNNIYLYETATRKWIRTLEGHTRWVKSVAFDAKGERLASGSRDNTVRLWEVASGRLLRTFEGHTRSVRSVAFEVKGERLASGSKDKTIRLWEVASGRLLRTLEGHTDPVRSVAFDAKGERLASGSEDKTIRMWEVASGQLMRTLEEHTDCVNSVAFDAKGERLASGSDDNTVRLWEVASGRLLRTLEGHTNDVNSVAFDAKGERLASGSLDNTVRLWDVASGQLLRTLEGHTSYVYSVAFDAQGERLASGSDDMTIRLWEVASGQLLRTLEGHTSFVSSVAFNSKGKRLASGSGDNTVRLWEVANGRLLRTLEGHTDWVQSVAFDAKGERLASGSNDNTVRLWDVQSGRCLYVLQDFIGRVQSVAWRENQQGSFLVTGSGDKAVRCWQVIEKEKGKLQVILRWTSHQAALTLTEVCIDGVKGLDATNLELLQQRGALSKVESLKEEKQFHYPTQHETGIESTAIEEKATPSKSTNSKNYSPGFFDSKQKPLSLESPASGKPAPTPTPSRCCVIL